MARRKGSLALSSNIEPSMSAPLDARQVVQLKADLTASDSFPYFYEGLTVYVAEEKKIYMLTGDNPTIADNWAPIGEGEGGTSDYNDLDNRPSINDHTLAGNKTGAQLGLVDAEDGKGLSTNDYTTEEKTKLAGIEAGAEVNVIEKITVNDTEQAITDKTVALTVITETVNNLVNYYTKTQTYTQDEVNALVSAAASGGFEVVETLPVLNIDPKKIYLVAKDPVGEAGDLYDEYIYVNEKWEHIGSTSIDLTAYQTKNLSASITVDGTAQTTVEGALAAINAALANYLKTADFQTLIASYYTKSQVDAITGDLDDLTTTEKRTLVGAINEAAQSGGSGVPSGGTTGQILTKKSNTDGDADWENAPSGLPSGGTAKQVLTKRSATDGDAGWQDVSGLPDGGDEGQVLAKLSDTDGDAGWVDPASVDAVPVMTGATQYKDGVKGLAPKPYIADREKALFGDGNYHTVYTAASGSTVNVITTASALYGRTVSLTDGETTLTATMGSDGECKFTDVQMYGAVTVSATDASGNTYVGNANLTYFGMYIVGLVKDYSTIVITDTEGTLTGQTVEVRLNGSLVAQTSIGTSGKATVYVTETGSYSITVQTTTKHVHATASVLTIGSTVSVSLYEYHVYAFVIDEADSNPATRVTAYESEYGCDNLGFKPAKMNYSTGTFDYGDWTGEEFFFSRPCLLGYNGVVTKYLNKTNYAKDVNGNTVDISSASVVGNVMVEFPTVYFKRWQANSKSYVVISDKQLDSDFHAYAHHDVNGNVLPYIYLAAYDGSYDGTRCRSLSGKSAQTSKALTNGRIMAYTTRQQEVSYAKANNANIASGHEGYNTWHKADWDMVRDLLTLIGMSTDYQTTFGRGRDTGYSSETATGQVATGSMNTKGMFWGENAGAAGVKVFGIENFWANIWKAVVGWINASGTQKVKMTYGKEDGSTVEGFNFDGSGYVTVSSATPGGTSGGYISAVKMGAYGLIPYTASGSETTYYCDGLWFNNSQTDYALVGGASGGVLCGAACSALNALASNAAWRSGAALSCK